MKAEKKIGVKSRRVSKISVDIAGNDKVLCANGIAKKAACAIIAH